MSNETQQADSSDQLSPSEKTNSQDYRASDMRWKWCSLRFDDAVAKYGFNDVRVAKVQNRFNEDILEVYCSLLSGTDYGLKNRVIAWADDQDLSVYHVQAFSTNKMVKACRKALDLPLDDEIWNLCFTLLETDIFGAK